MRLLRLAMTLKNSKFLNKSLETTLSNSFFAAYRGLRGFALVSDRDKSPEILVHCYPPGRKSLLRYLEDGGRRGRVLLFEVNEIPLSKINQYVGDLVNGLFLTIQPTTDATFEFPVNTDNYDQAFEVICDFLKGMPARSLDEKNNT